MSEIVRPGLGVPARGERRPWGQLALVLVTTGAIVSVGNTRLGLFGFSVLTEIFAAVAVFVVSCNLLTKSPALRAERALVAILTLTVAVPIDRIPAVGPSRVVWLAAVLVIALSGLLGSRLNNPRGTTLLIVLYAVTAFATITNANEGGLRALVLIAPPALVAFFLAGRLSDGALERFAFVLIGLALAESVYALVEAFVLGTHLWQSPTAVSFVDLQVLSSDSPDQDLLLNPFISGLERAQGTLGQPLPLGLLLLVAVAFLLRIVKPALLIRCAMIAVLLAGIVASGSRNSLLVAVVIILFFAGSRLSAARGLIATAVLAIGLMGAVVGGFLTANGLAEVAASGSYTHRAGAFESVPKLLDRPTLRSLSGDGVGSSPRLFREGLLQSDKLQVIDNQIVTSLAHAGLIGALCLILLAGLALLTCDTKMRPAVIAVVLTFVIFDSVLWPSAAMVTMLVMGAALRRPDLVEAAERHAAARRSAVMAPPQLVGPVT